MDGALDAVNELSFVCVASFGLFYEEVGGFEAGAEADVALAAEEGFVAPGFGELHVAVYVLAFFGEDEGFFLALGDA